MNFIVAVSKDFAIGYRNRLLFNLPSDLVYFKKQTLGKVVVMGERTYRSLPKRPLPQRTNVILSDNPNFEAEGAIVVYSVKELFKKLENYEPENVFVCGGASIYNLLMDYCDKAYITFVNASKPADTYINDITKMSNWELMQESNTFNENGYSFKFTIYKNNDVKKYSE